MLDLIPPPIPTPHPLWQATVPWHLELTGALASIARAQVQMGCLPRLSYAQIVVFLIVLGCTINLWQVPRLQPGHELPIMSRQDFMSRHLRHAPALEGLLVSSQSQIANGTTEESATQHTVAPESASTTAQTDTGAQKSPGPARDQAVAPPRRADRKAADKAATRREPESQSEEEAKVKPEAAPMVSTPPPVYRNVYFIQGDFKDGELEPLAEYRRAEDFPGGWSVHYLNSADCEALIRTSFPEYVDLYKRMQEVNPLLAANFMR
jgi:hypothetical protein